MKLQTSNPVLIEYSTWDNFKDSEAFVTEIVWTPWTLSFHKVWKEHISREILELYHMTQSEIAKIDIPEIKLDKTYYYSSVSNFLKKKNPPLQLDINHDWYPFNRIQLSVLSLPIDQISQASDRHTKQEHMISQPTYVSGYCMNAYLGWFRNKHLKEIVIEHLQTTIRQWWFEPERYFDEKNFLITDLVDKTLYIVCTDLGQKILNFLSLNRESNYIYE